MCAGHWGLLSCFCSAFCLSSKASKGEHGYLLFQEEGGEGGSVGNLAGKAMVLASFTPLVGMAFLLTFAWLILTHPSRS